MNGTVHSASLRKRGSHAQDGLAGRRHVGRRDIMAVFRSLASQSVNVFTALMDTGLAGRQPAHLQQTAGLQLAPPVE